MSTSAARSTESPYSVAAHFTGCQALPHSTGLEFGWYASTAR